jgi:hypothetical protein
MFFSIGARGEMNMSPIGLIWQAITEGIPVDDQIPPLLETGWKVIRWLMCRWMLLHTFIWNDEAIWGFLVQII